MNKMTKIVIDERIYNTYTLLYILGECLKKYIPGFVPKKLMSDAAPAIFNGFSRCYPNLLPGKCYFHMLKSMKDRKYNNKKIHDQFIFDISVLAKSSSQKLFDCSLNLFREKYRNHEDASIMNNLCHFEKYWLTEINIGWHSGIMSGTVITNNGLESTNGVFKTNFHGMIRH
jgi:hypothetical protein